MNKKEWDILAEKSTLLEKAAAMLKVEEKDLPRVIERFRKEIAEMEGA